jgi:hypothetical protein
MQLSEQVNEHAALGSIPEQDFGVVHAAVETT